MIHTTTFLPIDADRGLAALTARAVERSLSHEITSDGLILHLPWGDVVAAKERSGLRLTLRADDRTRLFLLQEAVDKRLDEVSVVPDRSWSLSEPGGLPPNLAFAVIDDISLLSPSYYRLRLSGDDLVRFSQDGLHFRILFPPDSHRGAWPIVGDTGRVEWPGGIAAWHRPVYTTRTMDPDSGTLTFDVFAHEGGRVTEWCRTLKAGDVVAIMGPGGEWYPDVTWLALFGDETALPAIARILEQRPLDAPGSAAILVTDEADIQTLRRPDGVTVRWLVRRRGDNLIEALQELHIPDGSRFVWYASEKSDANAARTLLLARGLDKSEMRTAAYWAR